MKRADHSSSNNDNTEDAPEPAAKRAPVTEADAAAAKNANGDSDDSEAYELFVAYQEATEGEGDKEEEEDEDAEEDIGSSDSDTSSDEEHRALTAVVSWRDGAAAGLLGAAQRAAVEAMSRSIYGGTAEGFREIADAVVRAGGSARAGTARVVGMLVLRARPAPVEITQAFVAPTLRDAGIGKRLVRRALDHASTVLRAARVVCFAVGGSGGFYARVGFAPVHARDAADAAAGTPCADRAEMACTLVPGTHYDVDSDDDDDDYDDEYYDDDFGDDDDDGEDDDE